jgi:hypothetical protein
MIMWLFSCLYGFFLYHILSYSFGSIFYHYLYHCTVHLDIKVLHSPTEGLILQNIKPYIMIKILHSPTEGLISLRKH